MKYKGLLHGTAAGNCMHAVCAAAVCAPRYAEDCAAGCARSLAKHKVQTCRVICKGDNVSNMPLSSPMPQQQVVSKRTHPWQTGRVQQCPAALPLAARHALAPPLVLLAALRRATARGPGSRQRVGVEAHEVRWRRAARTPLAAAPPAAGAAPWARLGSAAERCA